MGTRQWTKEQLAAITARNKTLLVSAGAGSGKTATLTERIIRMLLDRTAPVSLSDLLIVTFTNAAAGELRDRIGAALKAAMAEHPEDARLAEEFLTLPGAPIYTIDAFCNEVLRMNTDSVGLPPDYRIPDAAEADLVASSVMENVITGFYNGNFAPDVTSDAFATLADCLTKNRSDESLGEALLYLYKKTESLPEGVEALAPLADAYANPVGESPAVAYILGRADEMFFAFRDAFRIAVRALTEEGAEKSEKYIALLSDEMFFLDVLLSVHTYGEKANRLAQHAFFRLPVVKEKSDEQENAVHLLDAYKKDMKDFSSVFFTYTEDELTALFPKLHRVLNTLVYVLRRFDENYRAEKRRIGICEYSDLERYAYLCLRKDGKKTPLAESLAARYVAVYIDEYQDVNRLQDAIFRAISRPDNRFLVGDIKQSIYGFRSADPQVFADMKAAFPPLGEEKETTEAAIYMSQNFRCDRAVIDTVNEVFDAVFALIGDSIGYIPADRLICAKKEDAPYRKTEVLLVEKRSSAADTDANDTTSAQAEAAVVADRIAGILASGTKNDGTPVTPGDIAILLRSFRGRRAAFAEALAARGIPCDISDDREFFLNAEVLLVLCLLNAIDNPSRDIYLAGVMCSPLFGFTPDELVAIRKSAPRGSLFSALKTYACDAPDGGHAKEFLTVLGKYRTVAEGLPVDRLLFRLYRETGLLALAAANGGRENLLLLYDYARRFERSSRRGLYGFIHYINRLIENRTDFDTGRIADGNENAVHLMSVHASKGLEFPVVFVSGCAARMGGADNAPVAYAPSFGFAVCLRDESGLTFVKNPVMEAVRDNLRRDGFDEEMRILYVAMTRAREQLILSGTVKSAEEYMAERARDRRALSAYFLRRLPSFLDIVCTTAEQTVTVTAVPYAPPTVAESEVSTAVPTEVGEADPALVKEFRRRFDAVYPAPEMTKIPEKLSVSFLSPSVLDGTEEETPVLSIDTADRPTENRKVRLPAFYTGIEEEKSAARGIATHAYLQFCDLWQLETDGAAAQLRALVDRHFLSREDAELVRLPEIEKFRLSSLAKDMRSAKKLYREFRFHALLPAEKFTASEERRRALAGTDVLVQGVIDCIIVHDDDTLTLVDYKTDRLTKEELADKKKAQAVLSEKHHLQLSYYADAIEKIFGQRPSRSLIYSLPLGDTVEI